MDFHVLKRKELQALCKKHGIPANLKNIEMAERLSSLLKEENPMKRARSCLKNLDVVVEGDEEMLDSKEPKKVKFSPQNETFIFEKTDPREMRLLARKKRAFGKSKLEENPVLVSGNLGDVENEKVDDVKKPIEGILRRRSMVAKSDAILDSKIVDNAEKPAGRISRRKSVVVKTNTVLDTEIVENVDKPVERISRRRSVFVKPDALLDTKGNVDIVEKAFTERENLERNLRPRVKKTSLEDILLSPCVEKRAKRTRKGQGMVERGAVEEVDRPQEELLEKEARSTEMVAEISGKGDDGVGIFKRNNLAERGQARRPVRQVKKAKAQGQALASKENRNDEVLESEGVKNIGLRKKNNNVDEDVGSKEMKVVRRSRRQAGRSKVEASSCEQVNDDDKLHQNINHLAMGDHEMAASAAVGTDHVIDKDTVLGDSTLAPSLLASRESKVDELCHATRCSTDAEKIAKNSIEETGCSPNSLEKPCVLNVTMQSEDSPEEMNFKDQVPKNAVAAANNESSDDVESSVQAKKVEEALDLNYLAEQNSYEATASTPTSSLRRQFSGTMFGSMAEQTCVGTGEPICNSKAGSSDVNGPGQELPSASLGELKGEMRGIGSFESSEGLECYNQKKKEDLIELENNCEESPCISNSSESQNAAEEKMIDGAVVIVEKSDALPAMQENTPGSMGSCDSLFKEVEQTMSTFSVDTKFSHFISEEKVMGPVVSMDANVQPPNVLEGQTLPSNASAAILHKTMEEDKDIKTVTPLCNQRTDSSSRDTEVPHLVQSTNKDDSEARTEPSSINTFLSYLESQVDGAIRILSGSMRKGEESGKETLGGDISCFSNSIKANNLSEEDKHKIFELDEVNDQLEVPADDTTNFSESKELKHEKSACVTKHDGFAPSSGGETPALFQERKWAQVASVESISSGDFGCIRNRASECFSVLNNTMILEQGSMDHGNALSCLGAEDPKSLSENNSADPVNFEDRDLSETLHHGNALSCLGVESIYIDVSEHNSATETIAAEDELDFQLEDDEKSADCKITPQKQSHGPLENFSDTFIAQSFLSGLMLEEGHKETPSRDITCSANNDIVEDVAKIGKYISVEQPEEANCLQHLGSENDITNNAQSKDLESERVAWTTEKRLSGLGNEVENSALRANLAPDGDTLHCNVIKCISTVSDYTKDLELFTVKDSEDPVNEGVNSVTAFQLQDGKAAAISNLANAVSSGNLKSVSGENCENNMIKETTIPVREVVFCLRDDETSADLKGHNCNISVEPMENQMHTVSYVRDSSPFSAQKKTNLRFKIDNFTALTSKSVGSIGKEVENWAVHVEEAEGVGTCGNEMSESSTPNELDEAVGNAFNLQTKYVGSVEKELENISQQAVSVDGATEEGCNSGEKMISKSNSEDKSGEAVERGLAVQSSLLVAVAEEGKSDGGDEIVEVCPMEVINAVHINGNEKDSDSCVGHLEIAEKSCSPKRNSGKFSLGNAASGLENDAGSIVVTCSSLDRMSACYSADVNAAAGEIASDSLQTSQENKCFETLQNGLHSGEPMLLKDDQDNEDKEEAEVEEAVALPCKSSMPDEIISQTLASEMHDGPGSIAKQDIVEPSNKFYSAIMMESCSFGENEIEGALEYAPQEQFDSHVFARIRTGLEIVAEEQIDCHMDGRVQDTCMIGNDNSACSNSKEFGGLPCDIAEVSDDTNTVHGKSINSEAKLEFNADEGNCMLGQQIINEELVDGNTGPIHNDACMSEKLHRASEGLCNAERSTYTISVMDSAPGHYVYRESRSPAYNDTQELDFAQSPDVKHSQDGGDVHSNIVYEKSINSEAQVEFDADAGRGDSILGEQIIDQEHVDGQSCNLEGSPCTINVIYSAPENTIHRESSSAYNDDTQEVDSAKCPGVGDTQDVRGYSMEKVHSSPLKLSMTSESLIAMHDVLGSNRSERFVVPSVHEMTQEVPSDHPCMLNEERDNECCRGNSEPILEVKDVITHVESAPNPPSSICENEGVNLDASEKIGVDCAGDIIALSNSMEEPGDIAAELFFGPLESGVGRDVNDYDASDNKADADSSSRCVYENIAHQLLEQTHTPSVHSYQQMDSTESACQPGTITAVSFDNAENEDMKSNVEACLFTDSEIDLFWGEMSKDDVRELQREATDDTFSVNECEIMEIENFVNEKVAESGEFQQLGDDDMGEQRVEDDDKQREERGDSVDQVTDDEQNTNNLGNVAGKSADLDTEDKVLVSSVIQRKNTRSVLIHGTPKKRPLFMHDMKENTPAPKRLQMVNATAVKPRFNRKALEDIHK